MSWFPVDDAFHSHPKARKAGMEAIGLWTLAGSHCMAYLTDGFVADWWVKEKPRGLALATRLVAAGLWIRGECDGEQGYWFHDWKPECLKVNVLAAREKARQRKARSRESQRESRVTEDVTAASCLVPTQPNPTQPINPLVDLGGEVTQVDGTESPPRCPKHINDEDPPNCWACKRKREVLKIAEDRAAEAEAAATTERRQRELDCTICGGTNWIPHTEPAVKCNHQEVSHG